MTASAFSPADWAVLVVTEEVSLRAACAVLACQGEKITPEAIGRAEDAINGEMQTVRNVRTGYWPSAVALIRRGCAARAPAGEIAMAVFRLARTRSGGGLPLGYGCFRHEELAGLVEDEIAEWLADQKQAAQAAP